MYEILDPQFYGATSGEVEEIGKLRSKPQPNSSTPNMWTRWGAEVSLCEMMGCRKVYKTLRLAIVSLDELLMFLVRVFFGHSWKSST